MDCDIIEKVAELTAATPGDGLPDGAVRLLADACSLDSCAIYLWDRGGQRFTLAAHAGEDANCVAGYRDDEGVPGLVMSRNGPVEIYTPTPPVDGGAPLPGGGRDKGLAGFHGALAYPLADSVSLLGVLYIKTRKGRFTPGVKRALGAAAKELTVGLRCAELRTSCAALRKEAAELKVRLASSEKLLMLADMASTLAHEIRSPLISISGFTGRLKKKIDPSSPVMVYVEQIEKETARLEKLMNGMVRFLKDTPAEFVVDDLNAIMEEALGYFNEDFFSHGISLIMDLHVGPLPLLADRDQLKIAFDNLIANAIQSMDAGGTLTVRTGREQGHVVATLTDSGGGIDPENIKNIFNPFFTTKSSGTGLGLPIANSIVTRHHGFISVKNNAGVGVTFALNFPEAHGDADLAGEDEAS
ncbi:MAG: ATP-binding protein [Thermodesulfobacteriota bacterium]